MDILSKLIQASKQGRENHLEEVITDTNETIKDIRTIIVKDHQESKNQFSDILRNINQLTTVHIEQNKLFKSQLFFTKSSLVLKEKTFALQKQFNKDEQLRFIQSTNFNIKLMKRLNLMDSSLKKIEENSTSGNGGGFLGSLLKLLGIGLLAKGIKELVGFDPTYITNTMDMVFGERGLLAKLSGLVRSVGQMDWINDIKNAFRTGGMFSSITDLFSPTGSLSIIGDVFRSISNAFSGSGIMGQLITWGEKLIRPITTMVQWVGKIFKPLAPIFAVFDFAEGYLKGGFWEGIQNTIAGFFGGIGDLISVILKWTTGWDINLGKDTINKAFDAAQLWTSDLFSSIADFSKNLPTWISDKWKSFSNFGEELWASFSSFVIQPFIDIKKRISDLWDSTLSIFSENETPALEENKKPSGLSLFNRGGFVPGQWNGQSGIMGDSVLAQLTPGEFVLPRETTMKYAPMIQSMMNDSLPRFAEGGLVSDSTLLTSPISHNVLIDPILQSQIKNLNQYSKDSIRILENISQSIQQIDPALSIEESTEQLIANENSLAEVARDDAKELDEKSQKTFFEKLDESTYNSLKQQSFLSSIAEKIWKKPTTQNDIASSPTTSPTLDQPDFINALVAMQNDMMTTTNAFLKNFSLYQPTDTQIQASNATASFLNSAGVLSETFKTPRAAEGKGQITRAPGDYHGINPMLGQSYIPIQSPTITPQPTAAVHTATTVTPPAVVSPQPTAAVHTATSPSSFTLSDNPALNLFNSAIARGESSTTSDAYNIVLGKGKYGLPEKDLSTMTIGEVKEFQRKLIKNHEQIENKPNGKGSSAVGKGQFVGTTLYGEGWRTGQGKGGGLVDQLGLSDDTIFSPDVQNKMIVQLMKTNGLNDYLFKNKSHEDMMHNLSREWEAVKNNPSVRRDVDAQLKQMKQDAQTGKITPESLKASGTPIESAPKTATASVVNAIPSSTSMTDDILKSVNYTSGYTPDAKMGLGEMNPYTQQQLKSMADEFKQLTGKNLNVFSGYRSAETQQKIYDEAVKKYGVANASKWAAKPGQSRHNQGNALDIDKNDAAQLVKLGLDKKYGFNRPMDHEPWHFEATAVNDYVKANQLRDQTIQLSKEGKTGKEIGEILGITEKLMPQSTTPRATTPTAVPEPVTETPSTATVEPPKTPLEAAWQGTKVVMGKVQDGLQATNETVTGGIQQALYHPSQLQIDASDKTAAFLKSAGMLSETYDTPRSAPGKGQVVDRSVRRNLTDPTKLSSSIGLSTAAIQGLPTFQSGGGQSLPSAYHSRVPKTEEFPINQGMKLSSIAQNITSPFNIQTNHPFSSQLPLDMMSVLPTSVQSSITPDMDVNLSPGQVAAKQIANIAMQQAQPAPPPSLSAIHKDETNIATSHRQFKNTANGPISRDTGQAQGGEDLNPWNMMGMIARNLMTRGTMSIPGSSYTS